MRALGTMTMLAAAAAFGLLACGGPDPEAELAAASEALAEARAGVETARAVVERKKADLEEARQQLRQAEERLANASSQVDVRATDDVLFRTVQRRLLEDETLEGVAVRVAVKDGRVTLTGQVPVAPLAKHAVDLAAGTPGVVGVDSRIQVATPAVAAPPRP